MDLSLTGLRVLREVAERGSFTAAAAATGYTQSAGSRQVAALERTCGTPLVDRRRAGVRLTPTGRTLLAQAIVALDALDTAERQLAGLAPRGGTVRLGMFISAGAVIVPQALAALHADRPDIEVATREGTTPALVRALRAGTLALALLASRPPYGPPDGESPRLEVETLAEASLLLAVPAAGPFTGRANVHIDELAAQRWIASPASGNDPLLGVWPGLTGRPLVAHTARDWLTKLHLVAAGCGLTTVPSSLALAVPEGVRLLVVQGSPLERRRVLLARLPGPAPEPVDAVKEALREGTARLGG